MGYAKYTEDNILINYDRLYMKYGSDLFWGIIRDENFVKCPFCREKIRKNEMMNHINQIHENSVLLKYNALIAKENKYEEVNELNKLELFCNPKTIKSILITIEPSNRNIKINTVENEYEYDLMDYIEDFYFNEIKIIVKESEWKLRVNNEIDYSDLNINTIQMKKYRLDFFFEDLSSRYYEEDEAFSLLKLSIFENKMVDEVYEVLSSETMSSLFYQYYNLYKNDSNLIQPEKNNLSQSEWIALRYILDLRVDKAEEVLDKKSRTNNKIGLLLIISILKNDDVSFQLLNVSYHSEGIIGYLYDCMKFIKQIKINELLAYNYFNNKANCIKELSLFKQYKLIKIICEFDSCVQKGCIIKDDEFNILKRISSQILIYQYLKNKDEIILLEGIKMYPEDDEIKSILHKNKLEKKYLYTNQFINTLPNDCDYQIQSLCNESACCHYLKYKDLTILINCGSDYIDGIKIEPKYEMISSHVDYILITDISEACIGSFKKGYEIFSEAYIVTTEIIKNLLFFKYPDLNNKRFKIVRDEDCELTKNFNICFKNSGSNVGSYFVCMQSNEINIGYCYHYSFQNHLTTHMMNKSDLNFEFDYLIVGIYDSNNNYCYKKNLIDFLNDLIDRITTSNEVVLQVNGLAEFIELICILEQYVIDKTIGVFVDDKLLKYYEKLLSSQIEFRSMELDNKSVLRKIIIKTELNDLEKSNNLNIKMNNYLCLNQCVEDSKQLIELIKPKIITLFGTKSNLNSFIEDEIIRIKNQFDNDIVIKNVDDKKLNRIFEINLEE